MSKEEKQQQIHDIESQYPNLHVDLHRDQFRKGDIDMLDKLYKKLNELKEE